MNPFDLVNLAKLLGYDVIALTDHNSAQNCPAAVRAGEQAGIKVFPGMELCTAEEVHVVCLFPDCAPALEFTRLVLSGMPPVKNRADIFGEQLIVGEDGEIAGEQELLLTAASAVTFYEAPGLVKKYGGVCFPAHIDRPSYSVLSNLGDITSDMGFTAAEVSRSGNAEELIARHEALRSMLILTSSDAHRLEDMPMPEKYLNLGSPDELLQHISAGV